MSLNILIDARMVHPQMHGISRYTADLVEGLGQIGQPASVIICSKENLRGLNKKRIKNIYEAKSKFLGPLEAAELSWITNQLSYTYDVIHFPSFAVPLITPHNSVITIHDLIHLHPPVKALHRIYYKTLVKQAVKKCGQVITVSEWSKSDIHKKMAIENSKISVVRNGVRDLWFHSGKMNLTAPEHAQFICLSNPKPHKNVVTLVKACEELWDEGHEFKLFLSLGGSGLPSKWKLPAKFRPHVEILKGVSDEQLKAQLKNSLALVAPSRLEGFDYPVAEALALRVPVILSEIPSHEEFKSSLLNFYGRPESPKALAQKMRDLLTKKKKISGLGDRDGNEGSVLTIKEMARETLQVYKKVFEKTSKTRPRLV